MWIIPVLLATALVAVPPVLAQSGNSNIQFDRDFYTWTDKVHITINAPSWNPDKNAVDYIGDGSHRIKIEVRDGGTLNNYRLSETGPNTGQFTGEVVLTGFRHDADGDGRDDTTPVKSGKGPTDGKINSPRESTITVSFEYSEDVTWVNSRPIHWNMAKLSFLNTTVAPGQGIQVQLIDRDMNLKPESRDRVDVTVFSDYNQAGLRIAAMETEPDSGIFIGEVRIDPEKSSGNKLRVKFGGVISAVYDDHTLPEPFSISDRETIRTDGIVRDPDYVEIPQTESFAIHGINFTDGFRNPIELQDIVAGTQIQIVGTIQNNLNDKSNFVFISQVRDADGVIVYFKSSGAALVSQQRMILATSWTPDEPGSYTVESYVWESFASMKPLSEFKSTELVVG